MWLAHKLPWNQPPYHHRATLHRSCDATSRYDAEGGQHNDLGNSTLCGNGWLVIGSTSTWFVIHAILFVVAKFMAGRRRRYVRGTDWGIEKDTLWVGYDDDKAGARGSIKGAIELMQKMTKKHGPEGTSKILTVKQQNDALMQPDPVGVLSYREGHRKCTKPAFLLKYVRAQSPIRPRPGPTHGPVLIVCGGPCFMKGETAS